VGFDLPAEEGGSASEVVAAEGAAVFTGVSRRKQEQLQREQTETAKQRSKYDEREVDKGVSSK